MTTTTCHRVFLSAALSLCLALGACDRSSLTKKNDASLPGTTIKDAGSPDEPSSPDLGGKDTSDAPGSEVTPDATVADAPAGTDAAPAKDAIDAAVDRAADWGALEVQRGEVESDLAKVRLDASADGPAPCTPGGGSCNDNPVVSSIWGTCQADGTCLCKSGFEINPSTGRCRMPLTDAADATATCTGEFKACGCGCCGGGPRDIACYYPTLGESTATLKAKDVASKAGVDCNLAGCSAGVNYVCCMPLAPSPAAATYGTTSYMGDMEHVSISKSGSDCATLLMSHPGKTNTSLRIDGPANWGISGQLGGCAEAGVGSVARGAVGSVVMHPSGESCLVDVHVTLFNIGSDGVVVPTRLDADGLLVTDFPASACK